MFVCFLVDNLLLDFDEGVDFEADDYTDLYMNNVDIVKSLVKAMDSDLELKLK